MEVEYFARWDWADGRGIDALTEKKARGVHDKGRTYLAHLPAEDLVVTLRPETRYAALAVLGPSRQLLSSVALVLADDPEIEAIEVWQGGEAVVRLQGSGGLLVVQKAPFAEPKELRPKPPESVAFPEFGDYSSLIRLPRDPWAFVEIPDGLQTPSPSP